MQPGGNCRDLDIELEFYYGRMYEIAKLHSMSNRLPEMTCYDDEGLKGKIDDALQQPARLQ